jgi:uncharacterized Zn-binding protein involved in type VI secretion
MPAPAFEVEREFEMRHLTRLAAFGLSILVTSAPVAAQQGGGAISGGAADVQVEGQAAARAGDAAGSQLSVVGGSADVFINGKPAVRAGDATGCGGIVVGGSSTVFVNGKPLATGGSGTTPCR